MTYSTQATSHRASHNQRTTRAFEPLVSVGWKNQLVGVLLYVKRTSLEQLTPSKRTMRNDERHEDFWIVLHERSVRLLKDFPNAIEQTTTCARVVRNDDEELLLASDERVDCS